MAILTVSTVLQVTFDLFQNGGHYYFKITVAVVLLYHIWYEDDTCINTKPSRPIVGLYVNFTPVSRWRLSTFSAVEVVYYL